MEIADFSSGECFKMDGRIRVTGTLTLNSFHQIECLLEKIVDWKLIKKLDICVENAVPEELKNSFIVLLSNFKDDASIKLIPKVRYIIEEYRFRNQSTCEFYRLLKIFSSLKNKNKIDHDCIFSYAYSVKVYRNLFTVEESQSYRSTYRMDRCFRAMKGIFRRDNFLTGENSRESL